MTRFKHGWNFNQCFKIWANAQLEPVIGGSATWFKFITFSLVNILFITATFYWSVISVFCIQQWAKVLYNIMCARLIFLSWYVHRQLWKQFASDHLNMYNFLIMSCFFTRLHMQLTEVETLVLWISRSMLDLSWKHGSSLIPIGKLIWRLIPRREKALFNLEIKKKRRSNLDLDIHHSTVKLRIFYETTD